MNERDKEVVPNHPRGRGLILVILVLPLIIAAIVAAALGVRVGGFRVPPFPPLPAIEGVPCAIAILGGGVLLFGLLGLGAILICCCRKCKEPDLAELLRIALQPVLLALRVIQTSIAALVASIEAITATLNTVVGLLTTIAEALRTPGPMSEEEKARAAGLLDLAKAELDTAIKTGNEAKTNGENAIGAIADGLGIRR